MIVREKELKVRGVVPREVFVEEEEMDPLIDLRKACYELTEAIKLDMFNNCQGLMENISSCILRRDQGKLTDNILELITNMIIYSVGDQEFQSRCWQYKEDLRKVNGCRVLCNDGFDDFCLYCYLIRETAFRTIWKAYPGGISYEEFIHRILKKHHMAEPEYKKYLYPNVSDKKIFYRDEEQEKLLADNFKKYISNRNIGQGDIIERVKANRSVHDGVKDKNANGNEYIFPPIADYEIALYEFDFYLKKKNSSKKMNMDLLERIKEVSCKELEPYLGENMDEFLEKCRKIQRKAHSELEINEIEILIELAEKEMRFIEKNESDRFKRMGIWKIHEDLEYNSLCLSFLLPDMESHYFLSMADVLLECMGYILSNVDERNIDTKILWYAILDVGNQASQIVDDTHMWCKIYPELNSKILHEKWKKSPKCDFSPNAIPEKLKKNFVRQLKEGDTYIEEFMDLIFLLYDVESIDMERETLAKALKFIFDFLVDCRKKSYNIQKGMGLNIREELKGLESRLRTLGVDISADEFENSYMGYKIEQYFGKRYECRYKDIMSAAKELAHRKAFCGQQFLKKYLDMILKTRGGSWNGQDKDESEMDSELSRELYQSIFSFIYPSRVEDKDIHKEKQKILDFAEKYGFKQELGF